MKIKSGERGMQSYIGIGLLLLSISFPVSFFGGFGVIQDLGEGRIVDVLRANPQRYLDYVWQTFLSMILLPAMSLVLSIIGFVREIKHSTGILDKFWLSLTVFGGFFVFWGAYGFLRTSTYYSEVNHWADLYSSVDIAEPLQAVYAAVSVGWILWLLSGILFALSPFLKQW